MKLDYTIQTTKYIGKNFLYLFPFVLIPAFFFSLSISSDTISAVMKAFFEGNFSVWTFANLFNAVSIFNFSSWQTALAGFGAFIVVLPCMAVFTAFLEKHMRIGKRTFNGLWTKLNDNIGSTFVFGGAVLIIYEIWALLLSAMLYFMSHIPQPVVAYICIVLSFLAMHVGFLAIISTLYLWLPCMQITGFRTVEALHYSYRLLTPVRRGIFVEQTFFLFIMELLVILCASFLPQTIVFTILTTVLTAVLLLYYFVRMEIVYFDRDNMERMDLRKY